MIRRIATLALLLVLPAAATAGRSNRVYLVPAVRQCTGAATCEREFESAYTFDAIVLHTAATKYMPAGKAGALWLELRGVRDASHTLVNGTIKLRVVSGRVSIPGIGTFPDNSILTRVPPMDVPLKNGSNRKFVYTTSNAPQGTITNGGGVEVLDPDGNRIAVTGSQSAP